jgi:hypothetical protein
MGWICLGNRASLPQHAPPRSLSLRVAFTVQVAFRSGIRTPRVSGTGDAAAAAVWPGRPVHTPFHECIHTLLSNCVAQSMCAWSIPSLLSLSEPVCRSVGRSVGPSRPAAPGRGPRVCTRCHGGISSLEAARPHALRHGTEAPESP